MRDINLQLCLLLMSLFGYSIRSHKLLWEILHILLFLHLYMTGIIFSSIFNVFLWSHLGLEFPFWRHFPVSLMYRTIQVSVFLCVTCKICDLEGIFLIHLSSQVYWGKKSCSQYFFIILLVTTKSKVTSHFIPDINKCVFFLLFLMHLLENFQVCLFDFWFFQKSNFEFHLISLFSLSVFPLNFVCSLLPSTSLVLLAHASTHSLFLSLYLFSFSLGRLSSFFMYPSTSLI